MTRQEITNKVIDLAEDAVMLPIDVDITEQSVLNEFMDSFDLVDLSCNIDKYFKIEVDYHAMENSFNNGCTVKDIVDLIIKTKESEE